MHIPSRAFSSALFWSLLVWLGLYSGPVAECQVQGDGLKIVYTGRLFGYYRIEPGQTDDKWLPPVNNFMEKVVKHASDDGMTPIFLGMGDNFAPEFGASLQMAKNDPCQMDLTKVPLPGKGEEGIEYPESLYKNFNRIAKGADCDNVLLFLTIAGYRAIVPGREDFLYSAWWLNRIAQLLRDRQGSNPLTLLAANLRMKVAVEKQPAEQPKVEAPKGNCPLKMAKEKEKEEKPEVKDPKGICPLLLDPDLLQSRESCTDENTPAVIDWLVRLDRLVLAPGNTRTLAYSELRDRTTRNASLQTLQLRQQLLANETKTMESMPPLTKPSGDWVPVLAALKKLAQADDVLAGLKANGSYVTSEIDAQKEAANCLKKSLDAACKGKDNNTCTFGYELVTAHSSEVQLRSNLPVDPKQKLEGTPLFDAAMLARGREALLQTIYDSQKDIGFTEADLPSNANADRSKTNGAAGKVLIIGVVGQEAMNPISVTNRSICYKPDTPPGKDPEKGPVVDCVNPAPDSQERVFRATLQVVNPIPTIEAILRAAEFVHPKSYQYRVLMAQMPETEAQELESRLRADRGASGVIPRLDVILSEAQPYHATPNMKLQYGPETEGLTIPTPVVSPRPAYNNDAHSPLVKPDSTVVIRTRLCATCRYPTHVTNKFTTDQDATWACRHQDTKPPDCTTKTTVALLLEAFAPKDSKSPDQQKINVPPPGDPPTNSSIAAKCTDPGHPDDCNVEVMKFLLRRLQVKSHADVVLLERRDIFLEKLPPGYYDYEACELQKSNKDSSSYDSGHCEQRVAVDRILWKGDYYERVMLSGKDLASLMEVASAQSEQELGLMPSDTAQQWLVTFGIVTAKSQVLTRMKAQSDAFSVQQYGECAEADEEANPSAGGKTMYCVNGLPLQADHAYWVTTSDHLAEDKVIYTAMSGLPSHYVVKSREFLTANIVSTSSPEAPSVGPDSITNDEIRHQKRGIFQLDIGKVVAGYSFRQPQGGDTYVSNNFQGSTDARASSPLQAELDVEGKTRMNWKRDRYALGIQSNLQYDRSVIGNLSGNPVNASYPVNNFSIGGFLQVGLRLPAWSRKARSTDGHDLSAGKTMLVFAPYQYQTQLTGNYSFFPYSSPLNGQVTLHAPTVYGFAQKAGFRWEAGGGRGGLAFNKGTYVEAGGQWFRQNNVLSSVTLSTPGRAPFTCDAASNITLAACFKASQYPINTKTQVTAMGETLTNGGLYWDVHLQKALVKLADKRSPGISLVIESQGDAFFRRGAGKALSTQTLYDAPLSVALTFPIFRNFSLAPTYSAFFYGDQVVAQHLVVNSFVINVRWYFDRDSGVPLGRQLFFSGPASADETKTARIK